MIEQLQETLKKMQKTHGETYNSLNQLHQETRDKPPTKEELTDAAFFLKEIIVFLKDMTSEATALFELTQKLACILWVNESLTDDKIGTRIHGEYAVGSPDVKQMCPLPKRGTDAYLDLCGFFNLDPEAPIAFHWPRMVEYITERLAGGLPVPPGMKDATYTLYRLIRLTRKKGIENAEEIDRRSKSYWWCYHAETNFHWRDTDRN